MSNSSALDFVLYCKIHKNAYILPSGNLLLCRRQTLNGADSGNHEDEGRIAAKNVRQKRGNSMRELSKICEDISVVDKQITELYKMRTKLTEEAAEQKFFDQENFFDFIGTDHFDFRDAAVVFQGEEGAYSQQALMEFCGTEAKIFHVETWREAMEAIAQGEADYAVLPIENSSAGIVSENFDLLVEYDNYIIGEQIIRTNHCLLGLKESGLSDITDVYSHPQALMQCSKYLNEHPEWEKHSMKNTAGSAKKVKEDEKRHKAAIAAGITAEIYGLKILAEGIENNVSNSTRFIIVTGKKVFQKDADKISICFELPHKSGSLYRALSYLIYNNLNMNKIESRPIQGRTWEYRFFIDLEGNLSDENVQRALRGLEEGTEKLRILGNY